MSALHRRHVAKPDGRSLWLYARAPIVGDVAGVAPPGAWSPPNPHLRWHPLRGEWVAYASHRQARTFLPPPGFNPLATTTDPANPTELPDAPWDVAVFENRFPTLFAGAHDPPSLSVDTAPARGACEVVVYAKDPAASLGTLSAAQVATVVAVWADRTRELGARDDVAYVFPFENRGVEVGVTLHHPHGQIYAYPFVPPIAARELAQQRAWRDQRGTGLIEDLLRDELADGSRVVVANDRAAAFVPVFARYAYEVWVAPTRAAPSFAALTDDEVDDFAGALRATLQKLDGLWGRPMPYIMAFHQAPTDGRAHPEAHLHAEIYPALRMPERLKYLAGSEIGAGVFTADTLPEEKAAELRAVAVRP